MKNVKNYGLHVGEITPDQWTLELGGKGRFPIINPSGDWKPYLPKVEIQYINGYDTNACYIYGTINQIETLLNFLVQDTTNYSERWIAKHIPHQPMGGNPHEACERIRKEGMIKDSLASLQGVQSHEEYISLDTTLEMEIEANRWLHKWDYKHDWLFLPNDTDKVTKIKRGLQESPIDVSVRAWESDGTFYIKNKGDQDTHWCLCYSMNPDNSYNIFDTYDHAHKTLAPDYDFNYAKRISLTRKSPTNPYKDIGGQLKELFRDIIKLLWK